MRLRASGMSRPEVKMARVKRTASAPNSSMTSSGSITLPFVFDIFCPCSSRTRPLRKTCVNGARPEAQAEHDHARHPEEEDVEAGDEDIGRIEDVEIRRLVRPAHRRERPESGR